MPKEIKKGNTEEPAAQKLFEAFGLYVGEARKNLEELVQQKRRERRRQQAPKDEKTSEE